MISIGLIIVCGQQLIWIVSLRSRVTVPLSAVCGFAQMSYDLHFNAFMAVRDWLLYLP